MKPVVEKYRALLGRPPSNGEVERLERIAQSLGLREDDALWSVLIALEDYDRRYRLAPKRIEEAIGKAVESVRDSANQETRAAAARAIASIAEEAGRIGQEIAVKYAGRDRARWLAIMAGVCATSLLLTGAAAYYAGYKTGVSAVSDATAWALSNEGRQARALARTGSLPILTGCLGDGWRIETHKGRDICRPSGGAGWYIP